MSDAPFFEPLPQPEDHVDEEEQVVDLPWMPPSHVAGVVAPLGVDVFRSDDVVVRMTHAAPLEFRGAAGRYSSRRRHPTGAPASARSDGR